LLLSPRCSKFAAEHEQFVVLDKAAMTKPSYFEMCALHCTALYLNLA
jgi:hypothetical protein